MSGRNGLAEATVLFDTGSDRSYVTSDLVRKVGFEYEMSEPVSYAAFGTNNPSRNELRNIYNVVMRDDSDSDQSLLSTEIPVICAPLYRPEIPSSFLESFGDVQFADDYTSGKEVKVDILIGLDAYWKFVKPQVVNVNSEGLTAQATVFGWIFSGVVPTCEFVGDIVSHQMLNISATSFWDLEYVGISPLEEDIDQNSVLTCFKESLKQNDDGCYEVSLPWKPGGKERLINNENLPKLSKHLEKNHSLCSNYDQVILDMEKTGVVEEVPLNEVITRNPVFYMPHRPVVRESAVFRPKFGPCLMPPLRVIMGCI